MYILNVVVVKHVSKYRFSQRQFLDWLLPIEIPDHTCHGDVGCKPN